MELTDNTTIAGFGGSLRKDSYVKRILLRAATLMPTGSRLVIGDISNIPLFNQDLLTKSSTPVEEMRDLIARSDGFLIVTPEYNYSIPGYLKNVIDYVSIPPSINPFKGKVGALMSASTGMWGGQRAQYHLRQVFVYLDAILVNKPEVIIAQVDKKFNEKGEFIDEMATGFMKSLLNNLVNEVRVRKRFAEHFSEASLAQGTWMTGK